MTIALVGTNTFMLRKRLSELVSSFINEHGEMGLERFDGSEVDAAVILGSIQSLPFLATKKLVVVRDFGQSKQAADFIEKFVDSATDSTDLVLYDSKIDKRSVYYKYLKKNVQMEEFNELDERGLSRWLVDEAKRLGGEISARDASYLVERAGTDQLLLGNELEKLLSYDEKVSRDSIELLTEVAPQSRIFDLLDAAFGGNKSRAMQLYDEQRAQKVEPQQILAMLSWQLQSLAVVSTAGTRSPEEVAKAAGLNPFVVRKTAGLARKISASQLRRLVDEALELDYKSKTSALDLDEALKNYLITLS